MRNEDEPPDPMSAFPQNFCLKKAIINVFKEMACPRNLTLDIETLKQHLINRHAESLFKSDGAATKSGEDDLSMNSATQYDKSQFDRFNDRLKKLLNRNVTLFAKGPKMYSLPIGEPEEDQL